MLPELLDAVPEWLAQVCGAPLAHYAVVQSPPPPPPSPAAENPVGPKVPPDPDQAPTRPAHAPIPVNARAARPQWHEDAGDDWRKDMPSDDPPPGASPFAWAHHEPMRANE